MVTSEYIRDGGRGLSFCSELAFASAYPIQCICQQSAPNIVTWYLSVGMFKAVNAWACTLSWMPFPLYMELTDITLRKSSLAVQLKTEITSLMDELRGISITVRDPPAPVLGVHYVLYMYVWMFSFLLIVIRGMNPQVGDDTVIKS